MKESKDLLDDHALVSEGFRGVRIGRVFSVQNTRPSPSVRLDDEEGVLTELGDLWRSRLGKATMLKDV